VPAKKKVLHLKVVWAKRDIFARGGLTGIEENFGEEKLEERRKIVRGRDSARLEAESQHKGGGVPAKAAAQLRKRNWEQSRAFFKKIPRQEG